MPVGEEGWLVLVYAHQPGERPGGVSPESFVFLHGPPDDVLVDAPCEEAQLGAVEDSVIVDPASGHRVDIGGQAAAGRQLLGSSKRSDRDRVCVLGLEMVTSMTRTGGSVFD